MESKTKKSKVWMIWLYSGFAIVLISCLMLMNADDARAPLIVMIIGAVILVVGAVLGGFEAKKQKIAKELSEQYARKQKFEQMSKEQQAKELYKVLNTKLKENKKDASVIKRGIAGQIIAGPAGAVVGALSAVDKNNKNGQPSTDGKDASVIKRGIAGQIIAGPTGAIVGALSAVDKNNKNAKAKNES